MAWSLREVIPVGIWPPNPYPTLPLGYRTSYFGITFAHIEFPLWAYWPSANHRSACHQHFAGEAEFVPATAAEAEGSHAGAMVLYLRRRQCTDGAECAG